MALPSVLVCCMTFSSALVEALRNVILFSRASGRIFLSTLIFTLDSPFIPPVGNTEHHEGSSTYDPQSASAVTVT